METTSLLTSVVSWGSYQTISLLTTTGPTFRVLTTTGRTFRVLTIPGPHSHGTSLIWQADGPKELCAHCPFCSFHLSMPVPDSGTVAHMKCAPHPNPEP